MEHVPGIDRIRIGDQLGRLPDDIIPAPKISRQFGRRNRGAIIASFSMSGQDRQRLPDIVSERVDSSQIGSPGAVRTPPVAVPG